MSPCLDASVKEVISLKPDTTVQEAMEIFKEQNVRSIPVIDKENIFLGMFSLRRVLLKLLPRSVTMEDGLENLDFVRGAAPNISKRLKELYPLAVSEVMDTKVTTLEPNTALWEAARVMALYGSPIVLANKETREFEGLISRQTLLEEFDCQVYTKDTDEDKV